MANEHQRGLLLVVLDTGQWSQFRPTDTSDHHKIMQPNPHLKCSTVGNIHTLQDVSTQSHSYTRFLKTDTVVIKTTATNCIM